ASNASGAAQRSQSVPWSAAAAAVRLTSRAAPVPAVLIESATEPRSARLCRPSALESPAGASLAIASFWLIRRSGKPAGDHPREAASLRNRPVSSGASIANNDAAELVLIPLDLVIKSTIELSLPPKREFNTVWPYLIKPSIEPPLSRLPRLPKTPSRPPACAS